MHKFFDSEGKEWSLKIDFSSAKRLKADAGVDILDIAEAKGLAAITDDMETLGAAIWCLVEKQADAAELNEEQFFERFNGDVLHEATTALIAECFDFFPPQKRQLLKAAYDKLTATQAESLARAVDQVEKMTLEDFEKLATGLASDLKSLAKSESNRGASPSAS